MAKKYYDISRIKKVDAQYKILLGGRNIGKSYATKEDVIIECLLHDGQFTYLRRWDRDIKGTYVINYFNDLNWKKISEVSGKTFSAVYYWQGKIFLCNMDEDNKPIDKYHIGYAHSLSQNERYKSQMFPRVLYTIFEEFITDQLYLQDEPSVIQEYVSTIYRERKATVYMIGNTISKLCPYFNEWNLGNILNMKTHEIAIFENTTEVISSEGTVPIVVKIAVEMCGAEGVFSKMAFGSAANMIVKNEWRQKTVPRLDKDITKDMKEVYHLFVLCDNLVFKMILCNYNHELFWYVKPHTTEIKHKEKERIVSNIPTISRYQTNGFIPMNDKEAIAFTLIKNKKIFYCSNECGTDFQQALNKF